MNRLDEMEKTIIIKSALCAWISLEIGLVIFSFVYSVAMQKFDLLSAVPLVIGLVSLAVFFAEKIVLTKHYTKPETSDDEE